MAIMKVRTNYHQARWDEPMIFELSTPGVRGIIPPTPGEEIFAAVGDVAGRLPASIHRTKAPALPEVDQKHVLAHYLHLSQETLGSNLNADMSQGTCTMKYNPRVNEDLAAESHFANVHPLQDESTLQGILEIYYEFEQIMKAVSGMDRFTLQPGGGAHAVFTAASMIRATTATEARPSSATRSSRPCSRTRAMRHRRPRLVSRSSPSCRRRTVIPTSTL